MNGELISKCNSQNKFKLRDDSKAENNVIFNDTFIF